VKLVQTLNKVTAKRHHRQHFRFNSTSFESKRETPAGEYQLVARRSQQIWRNGQTLRLTASFIVDCLAAYCLAGGFSTFARLLETTNFIWGV
jgi:hypothetical protein